MRMARTLRWASFMIGVLFSASLSGYCGQLSQVELAVAGLSVLLFLGDALNTAVQ